MKTKEQKLEDVKDPHTLGWASYMIPVKFLWIDSTEWGVSAWGGCGCVWYVVCSRFVNARCARFFFLLPTFEFSKGTTTTSLSIPSNIPLDIRLLSRQHWRDSKKWQLQHERGALHRGGNSRPLIWWWGTVEVHCGSPGCVLAWTDRQQKWEYASLHWRGRKERPRPLCATQKQRVVAWTPLV